MRQVKLPGIVPMIFKYFYLLMILEEIDISEVKLGRELKLIFVKLNIPWFATTLVFPPTYRFIMSQDESTPSLSLSDLTSYPS
jgi:hypothetical protein